MARVWAEVQRVNRAASNIANLLGISVAFLLAFLITADIIGRYFFNNPITGTYEIATSVLVVVAFFGFSYTQQKRRHINVEMLTMRFSPRTQEILAMFGFALGLFFFGTITWAAWGVAVRSWSIKEWQEGVLHLPAYPTKFGVVFGAGLLSIQYIIDLVNSTIKLVKGGWKTS